MCHSVFLIKPFGSSKKETLFELNLVIPSAVAMYAIGVPVLYYSASNNMWIKTQIIDACPSSGNLQLACKQGSWIGPEDVGSKIRPLVGTPVMYYSATHLRWLDTHIIEVGPHGEVQVGAKRGVWIHPSEFGLKLRAHGSCVKEDGGGVHMDMVNIPGLAASAGLVDDDVLEKLDADVARALSEGHLRLVSALWLMKQPSQWRVRRLQDLPQEALLPPHAASALLLNPLPQLLD